MFCDNLFFFYEFICSRRYKIRAFYISNYSNITKHESVWFLVEKHKLVLFNEKLESLIKKEFGTKTSLCSQLLSENSFNLGFLLGPCDMTSHNRNAL